MGKTGFQKNSKEFAVILQRGSEQLSETVLAPSRHAAANGGEVMHPDFEAVAVTRRWDIAGRCSSCRIFIFTGERIKTSRGRLICEDCC